MARVFISYSRRDLAAAEPLRDALIAAGFDAYLDIHDIKPGEPWRERIGALIASAEKVVFLISPDSVGSEICSWEVDEAERHGKSILPVVLRTTSRETIPGRLTRLNFIFYREEDDRGAALKQLAEALSSDLAWEREKTRINDQAEGWARAGRPRRLLIWREDAIRVAEHWRDAAPESAPPPTEIQRSFIAQSRRAYGRRIRGFLSAAVVVALVTLGLAGVAYWQSEIAQRNEQIAAANAERAALERDQALTTQSLFLADLSQRERRDPGTGALLALAALPDATQVGGAPLAVRPFVPEAEAALFAHQRAHRERMALYGYRGGVVTAEFSPDGTRIVTAIADRTTRIWDAESGAEIIVLEGTRPRQAVASFSRDGARLLTVSDDNSVQIWDAASGVEIVRLEGHDATIVSASFDADGARVLTASEDGVARIWDAASGQELLLLTTDWSATARNAQFSPDGAYVVTTLSLGVSIADAASGSIIAELRHSPAGVRRTALGADGTRIVTAGDYGALLWTRGDDASDWSSGIVLEGHVGAVTEAVFSPDDAHIVTISYDDTARIWDATTGRELAVMRAKSGSEAQHVAFSPDGARIVTAHFDGGVMIWDAATGELAAELQGHAYGVYAARFSPDGAQVVSASDDGARVWIVDGRFELSTFPGQSTFDANGEFDFEVGPVAVALSPDDRLAAVGLLDGSVELWRRSTDELDAWRRIASLEGSAAAVARTAFSPDGTLLAAVSAGGAATVWRRSEAGEGGAWEQVATLRGHDGGEDELASLAFSPDGARLVTVAEDRTARVWDVGDWRELVVLRGHDAALRSVAFSADGARLATGSNDGAVLIWDASSFELVAQLAHTRIQSDEAELDSDYEVVGLAFSQDGAQITSATRRGKLESWDIASGRSIALRGGTTSLVFVAVFRADGAQVAFGRDGWPPEVVDVATGKSIAALGDPDDWSEGEHFSLTPAFTSDGARLVTIDKKLGLREWRIFASVQDLVDHAKRHAARCLTPTQRAAYFLPPEPERWCVTGPGLEAETDPSRWRPKWPYRTDQWRDWLLAKDRGEDPRSPSTSEMAR